MRKYTETHEWLEIADTTVTVGITEHAQQELGTIVYVELPKLGQELKAGEEACVLESTKAAADIYTPVSGTVMAINESLKMEAGLVNRAAENEGWLFRIHLTHPQELANLMDVEAYHSQFNAKS
jgi:glycine cleavage system H protein